MKKVWAILLMVLCFGMAATASAAAITKTQPEGSGTEANPYQIGTAGELYWYANQVNSDSEARKSYAELTANIVVNQNVLASDGSLSENASSFEEWTAIGNGFRTAYTGHFDGKGYIISGLYLVKDPETSSYVGLIGHAGNGAVIKNVTVEDSYFSGMSGIGGIIGETATSSTVTVENCHNSATVVSHTASNGGSAGGIIGKAANKANLKDCTNAGMIFVNTDYAAAVNETSRAGGLVGSGKTVTFENCHNSGNVTGVSYVGGLIGIVTGKLTTTKCSNTGDITGRSLAGVDTAGYYVGGILGRKNSSTASLMEDCYNAGRITGVDLVGGLAGSFSVNAEIKNSHNYGSVSSNNEAYGFSSVKTATNCYYLNMLPQDSKANPKTTEEFKNGTLVTLLNAGRTGAAAVWGQGENYPVFVPPAPPHTHDWTYSANGTTIIATCANTDENCPTPNGGSVTIAQPDNLVYSGASIEAKVTDTLTTGDVVSVTYSGENLGTDSKPTKPGTYTAEIELGGEEISVTYTIGKATLTAAGTGEASGVYGDKLSELTVSGLTVALNGANVVGTWALNGDMIPGVSTASATATFTPSANADCYEPLTETVTLSIAKKPVTAVVAASDKVYDGTTAAEVTASVNASDLISGDSITISGLTGTFEDINVGTDKAVMVNSTGVIIAGAENYDVTIPTTATASISKKPLTITASAQSIVFGGSISQTEYTCGELATGDTLESVTLTAVGTDGVGTGTITPSAAKIMRGTDNVTGNYDITYAAGVLNVGKQTIGSVAVDVTAPVQGAAPQSGIVPGSNYTGAVTWSPAVTGGVFDFNTAYTAAVILTPDGNHAFADTTTVPEGFDKNLNADGTLTLTKTFDKTRLPDLTGLKASLGDTLSVYCEDAAAAIALLPAKMTFETETGDLELAVQWGCESYEPEVGETNAFTWTVESAWEAVKDSYSNPNNVPLSGTVSLTNAEAVPVTITGAAAMQDLVYDGTAKQGYTGTPTSAEYAGPFTITYTGMKGDGSSYGPTGDAPADAGEYTVTIAVPATGTAYSGQMQIAFSIAKAVPTGEPVFTPVYRDGRTLADAGLTTVGGTFSVEGAVAWNDPSDTIVEEGKAYGWTFTPASGNYAPITGGAVVYPAGDAPVIDEPAGAQTISAVSGSTATMTVAAQGTGELAYQWYVSYDGGKTFEPIDGATQAEYTTSAVKPENSGYQYYCLVTNLYGEAASPVFTLSVINPAVLPKTGDSGSLSLWFAALTASMLALAGAARRRRAAR